MPVTITVNKRFLFALLLSASIRQVASLDPPIEDQAPYDPEDHEILELIRLDLAALQLLDNTVRWIIHIGELLFNVPGSFECFDATTNAWVLVTAADPIIDTEYRFQPNNQNARTIYLTRFMQSSQTSIPDLRARDGTLAPQYAKDNFHAGITLRENQQCLISSLDRTIYPCVNSHLIPKALGPIALQYILQRYMQNNPPQWTDADAFPHWNYHIGVLLYKPYDTLVDNFTLSFYNPTRIQLGDDGLYVAHDFNRPMNVPQLPISTETVGWTKIGLLWRDAARLGIQPTNEQQAQGWQLHGQNVDFNGRAQREPPPWEVVSWHYLQCVLHKWGQADYKQFANITW